MTAYRRHRIAGGTYFFTVAVAQRHLDVLVRNVEVLKHAIGREKASSTFAVVALVILPDHLHAVWRLPPGDADYSNRWRRIKAAFSRDLPQGEWLSESRQHKGERGIWQRRFWEHTIRDEVDLQRHVDYVHFNPVKHGYVKRATDWAHSTFSAYVQRRAYPPDWGVEPDVSGEYGDLG